MATPTATIITTAVFITFLQSGFSLVAPCPGRCQSNFPLTLAALFAQPEISFPLDGHKTPVEGSRAERKLSLLSPGDLGNESNARRASRPVNGADASQPTVFRHGRTMPSKVEHKRNKRRTILKT
jgi:hypothetical protein